MTAGPSAPCAAITPNTTSHEPINPSQNAANVRRVKNSLRHSKIPVAGSKMSAFMIAPLCRLATTKPAPNPASAMYCIARRPSAVVASNRNSPLNVNDSCAHGVLQWWTNPNSGSNEQNTTSSAAAVMPASRRAISHIANTRRILTNRPANRLAAYFAPKSSWNAASM